MRDIIDEQRESLVDVVGVKWEWESKYNRLREEKNRLKAQVVNLEDEVRRRKSNNDDNNNNNSRGSGSRKRIVGFGFFGER